VTDRIDHVAAVCARLCDLPGYSGREGAVRARVAEAWTELGLDVTTAPVGNLLAHVGGAGERVLLVAHMDEVGFVVREITEDGFVLLGIMFSTLADQQAARYPVGHPAAIMGRGGKIARGIFAAPSGHIVRATAEKSVSGFYVDLGLSSADEVRALGVHPGAPVVFDVPTRRLGNRIVGKAFDDRLMLAVIQLLLERLDRAALTVDLWVAATVQEENGFHGASALAANERFDSVLALDVGLCDDTPLVRAGLGTRLGGGPIVVHDDMQVAYHQELCWRLVDAAERAGQVCQQASFSLYGTDGRAFYDSGTPAAVLATPVRYTHTAFELADVGDVDATVAVLESFLTAP
jgi:putative aminopeptidase FrvX